MFRSSMLAGRTQLRMNAWREHSLVVTREVMFKCIKECYHAFIPASLLYLADLAMSQAVEWL